MLKARLCLPVLIVAATVSTNATITSGAPMADEMQAARSMMVKQIQQHAEENISYTGKDKFDQRIIDALATIPRHRFVPEELTPHAYLDRPLSIGKEQTISQPYIVALMTDLIQPQPHHKVLEIGTGSGYQAAILAELVGEVYSIEIIPELAARAKKTLSDLGYSNISLRTGNGYLGWPEAAPFDGIIVTAGGDIPPLLLEQLSSGGRMVIPVNQPPYAQYLVVIDKSEDGSLQQKKILPVRFVPLIKP